MIVAKANTFTIFRKLMPLKRLTRLNGSPQGKAYSRLIQGLKLSQSESNPVPEA